MQELRKSPEMINAVHVAIGTCADQVSTTPRRVVDKQQHTTCPEGFGRVSTTWQPEPMIGLVRFTRVAAEPDRQNVGDATRPLMVSTSGSWPGRWRSVEGS